MQQKNDLATVVAFVDRTVKHGVPIRVALTRGSRRFGVDRDLLRMFYRTAL